ncbi:MAG: diguanylate cyclase [Pseudomonadota bacterium]
MSPFSPSPPRYSQRFVFIGLIGVVLLALSASFLYVIQAARQQQIEQALNTVLSKAQLVALAHDQWLEESRNLLATLAVALDGLPDLERDCSALLATMTQATRGVDTMLVARPDGAVVCAPHALPEPVNVADRLYFRRALELDGFAVGEYIIGRVSGEPVLPAALPLRDASGEVRYVVILGRKLSWVETTLARQRYSADTTILLIDGKGRVMARAPDAAAMLAQGSLTSIMEQEQGVLEVRDVNGAARYLGFTTLGQRVNDAYVVVSVPAEEVLAPVRAFLLGNLVQFAVAAMLIFALLWFGLGYWVLRPLRRLLAAMEGVRGGNLALRLGVQGGTVEMVKLAQSFDGMVSELQQADARLRRQSDIDGLLGIANRRAFDETLAQEWGRAQRELAPLSLLMIDVDYFKNYNDSYGHQAGDRCLQQIAAAIAATLKRPADVVARYGGEEFAVVLPRTDAAGADGVARAIQNEVARLAIPHAASRASDQVTVSIGIATLAPAPGNSPEILIHGADSALYRAKHEGRNRRVHAEAG